MTKRKYISAGILLMLGFGFIVFLTRPCLYEPEAGGRRLSEWILICDGVDAKKIAEAEKAIISIGTNAIPYALVWIQQKPKRKAPSWLSSEIQSNIEESRLSRQAFANAAITPFRLLGSNAVFAIPELIRVLRHADSKEVSSRALECLTCVGPEAVPEMIQIIRDTNVSESVRQDVICTIAVKPEFALCAKDAIPVLTGMLDDPPVLADFSALAIARISQDSQVALPALAKRIQMPSCSLKAVLIAEVGRFNGDSAVKLPIITAALNDSSDLVRRSATNALLRIEQARQSTN